MNNQLPVGNSERGANRGPSAPPALSVPAQYSALLSSNSRLYDFGVTGEPGKDQPALGEASAPSTRHAEAHTSLAKNGRRGSLCPYLTRKLGMESSSVPPCDSLGGS